MDMRKITNTEEESFPSNDLEENKFTEKYLTQKPSRKPEHKQRKSRLGTKQSNYKAIRHPTANVHPKSKKSWSCHQKDPPG